MTDPKMGRTAWRGAALVACAAMLAAVPQAGAQLANTAWPIISHDNQHTGRTTVVGPQTNAIKWVRPIAYLVKSSPVIGNAGRIYHGNAKTVCALDPSDGSDIWCTSLPGIVRRSSPTLAANGSVYVGTRDNRLWSLDANDGSEQWSYTVGNDGDVNVSPAVAPSGTIYMSGTINGLVHALTPQGDLLWKHALESVVSYSSPALANDGSGTIYFGTTRGGLHALSPAGDQIWEIKVGRRIRFASPSVGADGTIYVGSTQGLAAVHPNGQLYWNFTTTGSVAVTPALGADGTIYFGSVGKGAGKGARFYAVNPNGTLKWSFGADKPVRCSPVVGGDGTIYGGVGPTMYAFNPNGTVKWQYDTSRHILGTPAIAGDGTLYIGSDGLYAFGN
jgi:outer membrane protein assembly factor BamB